jgi:hypothetical protein
MPSQVPKQFDLVVYDNFATKDQNAPLTGVSVQGSVTVTISWNAASTDVVDKEVAFSDPVWVDPGCGPLTIYDEAIGGGVQPVGAVAWKVNTSFQKTLETDTPNNRCRWTITPVIDLVRTVTSTVGNPTETDIPYTATANAKGGWIPIGPS